MNRKIQYILILLVLTAIAGGIWYFNSTASTKVNSSQETKLTDGLVLYQSFDGNHMDWSQSTAEARDQSGANQCSGSPCHGDVSTSGMNNSNVVVGKVGQALDFDGSSEHVDVGDIDITDQITASAWINLESFDGGTIFPGIISKNYTTAWYFGMSSNTRNLTIWINNGARATTTSEPINFNEWAHVAFTYNKDAGGTNEVKIYVNGSQIVTGDYSTVIGTNDDNMEIGKNFGQYFDGQIDEVRIYDRALSAIEITELYNQGQVKINASQDSKFTDGLVGYWSMDGNDIDWSQPTAEARNQAQDAYHGDITGGIIADVGKIGQAINSDSVNGSYVNAGNITEMNGVSQMTASMWVKSSGGVYNVYMSKGSGNNLFSFHTGNDGDGTCDSDGLCIDLKNNTSSKASILNGIIQTGEWVYLTVVFDGTQSVSQGGSNSAALKLYRNGILQSLTFNFGGAADIPATISNNANNLMIGAYTDSGMFAAGGLMDEVRIYNRALSQNEITELYNQGQAKINASQDSKLTDGLVGNWTFDGNHMNWSQGTAEARDQAGSNHGNVINATAAIGKVGQGLVFDGSGDYISVPENSNIETSDMTFSFWINNKQSSGSGILFMNRSQWNTNNGFQIWASSDNLGARGSGTPSLSDTDFFTGYSDTWVHVVITYEGTDIIFYRNGANVSSGSVTAISSTNHLMCIGAYGWNCLGGSNFEGIIDEVRIYNRALTADEISQLYNMGK